MGKTVRFFKQSAKSLSGNQGARNYAMVNRVPWHSKIVNFLKVRGKQNVTG